MTSTAGSPPTREPEAGIRLAGVGRAFGPTVAVSGVSLTVPLHGRLSIIGPSGCGKSTLLNMISGLDDPNEGTVEVLGATTSKDRLRRCAWMPQRDLLLPWRDVLGNAALALENQGMRRKAARSQVAVVISVSGFTHNGQHSRVIAPAAHSHAHHGRRPMPNYYPCASHLRVLTSAIGLVNGHIT